MINLSRFFINKSSPYHDDLYKVKIKDRDIFNWTFYGPSHPNNQGLAVFFFCIQKWYLIKSDFGKWNPPPLSPNPETIRGRHNTIKQNFMSDLLGSLMKNEWKVLKKNSIVKLLSIWIDLFNVHTCAERKKVLRFVFWHFQCPLLKSFQHLTSYCMYWNSIMKVSIL